MTAAVWKFEVKVRSFDDTGLVVMPLGAVSVSVGFQNEILQVWAFVPDVGVVTTQLHRFRVFGTGHLIESDTLGPMNYLGRASHHLGLEFHVFEETN